MKLCLDFKDRLQDSYEEAKRFSKDIIDFAASYLNGHYDLKIKSYYLNKLEADESYLFPLHAIFLDLEVEYVDYRFEGRLEITDFDSIYNFLGFLEYLTFENVDFKILEHSIQAPLDLCDCVQPEVNLLPSQKFFDEFIGKMKLKGWEFNETIS